MKERLIQKKITNVIKQTRKRKKKEKKGRKEGIKMKNSVKKEQRCLCLLYNLQVAK